MNPNKELEAQIESLVEEIQACDTTSVNPATTKKVYTEAILDLITQSQHTAVREFVQTVEADLSESGEAIKRLLDSHLSEYLER